MVCSHTLALAWQSLVNIESVRRRRTLSVKLKVCLHFLRIVGGCDAGHVPWYVYIKLKQEYKCGGVLINKVGKWAETRP